MNIELVTIFFIYSILLYLLNVYFNLIYFGEYLLHFFEVTRDNEYYDYIIVGCGTAGSLIAHQLSSLNNVTFVVLEAGGSAGPLLQAPALGPLLQKSIYDWQYKTTPQYNACQGFKDKMCSWPMGKILGGSARFNNMIHFRGYLDEITQWFANIYNISGVEKYLTDLEKEDLFVNEIPYETQLSEAFLNAGLELGFQHIDQSTVPKVGFMKPLMNQVKGSRWATVDNLHSTFYTANGNIISNAFVHKLLLDKEESSTIAKSVQFEKFGRSMVLHARKGIILTAGAVGTPKILLLSGIGPKDHLQNVNIPLIKDLPVGENLMDHVTTGLDLILLEKPTNLTLKALMNPMNAFNYFFFGKGPWTSPGCEGLAFINTNDYFNNNQSISKPNLQFMLLPVGISSDQGLHLKNIVGISDSIWNQYFSKLITKNSFTILPIVLQPKSRGKVYLPSNDPYDLPLINANYFDDPDDVDTILDGINIIKHILQTNHMKKLGATLNTIPFPGCEALVFDSKEYWLCYIKHLTLTAYHPVGTCKMGPIDDESSMVDYNFSVKGIKNLYIADASVFPTMPSGNPNTAVALVAKIFSNLLFSRTVKES